MTTWNSTMLWRFSLGRKERLRSLWPMAFRAALTRMWSSKGCTKIYFWRTCVMRFYTSFFYSINPTWIRDKLVQEYSSSLKCIFFIFYFLFFCPTSLLDPFLRFWDFTVFLATGSTSKPWMDTPIQVPNRGLSCLTLLMLWNWCFHLGIALA